MTRNSPSHEKVYVLASDEFLVITNDRSSVLMSSAGSDQLVPSLDIMSISRMFHLTGGSTANIDERVFIYPNISPERMFSGFVHAKLTQISSPPQSSHISQNNALEILIIIIIAITTAIFIFVVILL